MNKVIITIGVFFTLCVATLLTAQLFESLRMCSSTEVQPNIPTATENQVFIGLRPPTKFKINDIITRKDGFVPEGVMEQCVLINSIQVNPVNGRLGYYGTTITRYENGNRAFGSAIIDVQIADKLYRCNGQR